MTHYNFDTFEKAGDHWSPSFVRTQKLVSAIDANSDYELIEARILTREGRVTQECLIVEVTCDGVPPQNNAGIQYREQLAIIVSDNNKALVSVYVLRKDFKILMHMNAPIPGYPLNLCLYFEPIHSVLRTWTPQKFLRRIQWWLTMSARGELHPADQPVEQLFYVTPYELVLPWNFAAAVMQPNIEYRLMHSANRLDGGATYCLQVFPTGMAPVGPNISVIMIDTPPVVHGTIELPPNTLGELDEILSHRGVNFITLLRESLLNEIPGEGISVNEKDRPLILLIRTPVIREIDSVEEKAQFMAFLPETSRLKLGVSLGAIFISPEGKTYYADRMGQLDTGINSQWKSEKINAVDVLFFNDQEQSRRQSGLVDAGPKSVLVGVGSLGSAMLDIWSRSGWGVWYVVDNDHLKPHNLVRHTAYSSQVGKPKVIAVSELYSDASNGAAEIVSINENAADLSKNVIQALTAVQLVVDASASLEYPRAVNRVEQVGRHVSVFITPNGGAAVLMAEDIERKVRLVSLEGQYYRGIINNAWGQNHLEGNLGSYWSGGSCRDISLAMPYSRVLVHAACLAEHIQLTATSQIAAIKIWQRNLQTGEVSMHEVPTYPARSINYRGLDIFIDEGLEQKLLNMREAMMPDETGGILLGYYDLKEQIMVIVDACPAPLDSVSTKVSFERGVEGVSEYVKEVQRLTADIVGYVGEWHSHPSGVSALPSRDDLFQLTQLALGMSEDGLPAISLIVAEDEIKIYQGEVL